MHACTKTEASVSHVCARANKLLDDDILVASLVATLFESQHKMVKVYHTGG